MCVHVCMYVCVCKHTLDTRWHVIYKYRKYGLASHRAKANVFFIVENVQASDTRIRSKFNNKKICIAGENGTKISLAIVERTVHTLTHN